MKKLFVFGALALAIAVSSPASSVFAQDDSKAEPKNEPTLADELPKAKPAGAASIRTASPKVRPLSVTVDLLSNTAIVGTLTDITNLDMQTSFGTANIPLSEVAAVRFATAEDATTTVVMLNGDSITGATDVKLLTVETEWGSASINGQSIKSIMFVPNVVWSPHNGLNGKRWVLVSEKEAAQQAAEAAKPANTAAAPQPETARPIRNPDGSLTYPSPQRVNNSLPSQPLPSNVIPNGGTIISN